MWFSHESVPRWMPALLLGNALRGERRAAGQAHGRFTRNMFRRSILRLVFGSHKHLSIGIFFIVLVMVLGVACSGDDGALGAAGAPGASGSQGVDGAKGSAGEAGQAGSDGSDGSDGRTGSTGATGAQGATGPTGISARLVSLVNAPVLANGTVAGAPTEFVINLDVSMDPAMPGKSLLKGNTIKITLPDDFADTGSLAFKGVGSEDCVPGNLQCTTGVLLPGWPQHPIGPPFKMYDINLSGSNSIVFTALEDILADPPSAPGIKQIHLILKRFTNPGPGQYAIKIESETGPNGAVETSWGQLHIIPEIRPFISLTSAMNPGTPNTIYQSAAPGTSTPFGYDLLLWNAQGEASTGVTIEAVGTDAVTASHVANLMQAGVSIGRVFVDGPEGASVSTESASVEINAPITGVPTGHLAAAFTAGATPGDYMVTFKLFGGNSIQTFITVQ